MTRRALTAFLGVALVLVSLPVGTAHPASAGLPDAMSAVGHRSMTVASPGRGGEVPVSVWYPVAADDGIGALVGGSRVFEPTPARTAALPQGRNPLLVIAHGGLRSARHVGDWLAAGLAQRGYVVALVEPVPFQPDAAGVLREVSARPADLSAVISALLGNTDLSPAIDPLRIGAVGLLRGGTSVMALLGARISGERYATLCERSPDDRDCRWFAEAGISFAGQDFGGQDFRGMVADRRDPRVVAAIAVAPELTSVMTSEGLAVASPALSVLLLDEAEVPGAKPVDLAGSLPPERLRTVSGATAFSLFPVCRAQAAELFREEGEDESLCREGTGRDRMAIHRELTELIVRALSDFGLAPAEAKRQ